MTKILIVDDIEQNLYLLKYLLGPHRYTVVEAKNGVEALEAARRDPPDLIISDILMPTMDGFALCREWTRDEQLKTIPFVFYTATYTDPKDEELGLKLGAARFIIKPVEAETFIAIVQEVLHEHAAGHLAAPVPPLEEETVYYRLYNGALVRKLEDKMLTLEQEVAERQQGEETLRRYTERLRILHEVHLDILAAQAPTIIAQTTLKRLRLLIPCQRASVTLFEAETQEILVFAVDLDHETVAPAGFRYPLTPEFLAGLALDRVMVLPDAARLAQPSRPIQLLMAEGLRAYLSAPLTVEGQIMGLLNLAAAVPEAFTAEQVEVATEVARQLAIALHQARLHESVSQARERLETLSRQLLQAQEMERRRLARELHDEIGQSLSMVKIDLHRIQQLPQLGSLAEPLGESVDMVERALQQVRALSVELRPSLLDDLGLVPALRWYVDRQAQRGGFAAYLAADALPERLAPELETVCFRLVQEALTNVLRYAQARQVEVELKLRQAQLQLAVRDDGAGFSVSAALARAAQGGSLGLLSMQERAALVGGRLDIRSTPGHGTEIRATLPLKYASPAEMEHLS